MREYINDKSEELCDRIWRLDLILQELEERKCTDTIVYISAKEKADVLVEYYNFIQECLNLIEK